MTVSGTTTKVSYDGDGSTIIFPITFSYFDDTDIRVIVRDADGEETVLVLNTDFEIPAEGEENEGNIVLINDYETDPPDTGETVLIKRILPIKQLYDFIENESFPAENFEDLHDKAIMIMQQIDEEHSRTVLLKETSTLSGLVLPEKDGDSRYLRWNDAGDELEVAEGTATDGDAIHDNVADEIDALTEKGSPANDDLFLIEDSEASGVKKKVKFSSLPGAGGGETNTMSSQGTGTSLYYQKSGVDLQLNAIKSENALLTVSLDSGTHDVELTVNEGSIDHDNLTNTHNLTTDIDHDALANFVANEHLDWTGDQGANNIHANNITEGSVTQHQAALSITESQISDLDHDDTDAIHDNVTGEIDAVTGKTTPVSGDLFLIEDSAASNAKKKLTFGNLQSTLSITESQVSDLDHDDTDAIHDNVASEISALSEKASPVSGDLIIIEDSADSNNKKKVQIGNLPTGGGGEANTASSQGTGVSVYYQKSGIDIQLNAIKSENSLLTVSLDSGTHDIELTVNESSIDHDNLTNTHNLTTDIDHDALTNFVANEHLDWTGDQGANNIHANNITEGSVTQHQAALSITESQVSDLDHTDTDAIHDDTAGEIVAVTEKTTLVANDEFLIEDSADSNNKKSAKVSAIRITESQVSDLGSYLENTVEDTTPQLGGDLDLNSHAIDFPTTANISDCLDEDNMASDSATALATQQSIKAYVDTQVATKIGDVVDDTTPQLGGDLDLNSHAIDFPTTANISDCLDEDNMASDSATSLATQQSIKAYVDTQVATQIANVVEDTTPQLGGDLDLNDKTVDFSGALASDHTGEGMKLPLTVTGLSFGQCVYVNGNLTGALADADAAATMPAIGLYMATNEVLTYGVARNDSWSWTANDILYVGTDGNLTATAPSGTGDQIQRVAVAINATHVFVNPSLDVGTHT